ncbi:MULTISPECIES: hypothetical protein [Butyricimonas]
MLHFRNLHVSGNHHYYTRMFFLHPCIE